MAEAEGDGSSGVVQAFFIHASISVVIPGDHLHESAVLLHMYSHRCQHLFEPAHQQQCQKRPSEVRGEGEFMRSGTCCGAGTRCFISTRLQVS